MRTVAAVLALLAVTPGAHGQERSAGSRELRVCADPNNLPFSNNREQGFENKLAQLVAGEMNARVRYTWWAQRRGFIRSTLRALDCDLVMGVPSSFELVAATRPYYRSTYVFVARRGTASTRVRSFEDPLLRKLRVGVHLIGDDYANTPPAHALTNRGIVRNVRGFSIYGDYSEPNPPARILDALARSEIDMAIVWGPLAGYFSKQQRVPFVITPVSPQIDLPFLPMVFDISMGVRREDVAFREALDRVLVRRREDIEKILDEYGVPRVGNRHVARAEKQQ
jgi:mxaJ protein